MAESFATIAALISAIQLLVLVALWTNYKYGITYERVMGEDELPFYKWPSVRWWRLVNKQSVVFLAICSVSLNALYIVGRDNLTEPNLPVWLLCLAGIYLSISLISRLICLRLELNKKARNQRRSRRRESAHRSS
jgi:hypothetical protein